MKHTPEDPTTWQADRPEPTRFERWAMRGMDTCKCPGGEGRGPHDFWRHPIRMPLIFCALILGFHPEAGRHGVRQHWQDGRPLRAVGIGLLFGVTWILALAGFLVAAAVLGVVSPFCWLADRVRSR